jgi:SWI/SNF-related matrix-associated actin-dependent regulator of chromatin subfamily A3
MHVLTCTTGWVGPGEEVELRREPTNRYDANAVQVLNIGGNQIGHIPRNVCVKLVSDLDT